MPIDWDKFKEDGFARWDKVGKHYEGLVVLVRTGSYMGKEFPELVLDQGPGRRELTLGVSQANLQRQMADDPPELGDYIEVTYTGDGGAKAGQNPVKLFSYERKAGTVPKVADLA